MPLTKPQPSAECMDRPPEQKGNAEAGLEKEKEGRLVAAAERFINLLPWR